MIDLGGGTGHLAIAACERYRNLRAVVFDLADALGVATEIVSVSSVADRIEIVAGDFFVDSLPPGDLYALGRILHDWTEEKIVRLMRRAFTNQLPAKGAVLIAEKLLEEDRARAALGGMHDLNMLSLHGGQGAHAFGVRSAAQAGWVR